MPIPCHLLPDRVESIQVIHVSAMRGDGSPENPARAVELYFSPEGALLACHDPLLANTEAPGRASVPVAGVSASAVDYTGDTYSQLDDAERPHARHGFSRVSVAEAVAAEVAEGGAMPGAPRASGVGAPEEPA